MNETECTDLYESVQWTDPGNLISLAILAFINVLVIAGNLLVIVAVLGSNKLRSVTNFFIVSLAVADLLVGLAVLPFSATWEVFKVWIFGDLWCRVWLAVDVWMCTASILNLCAISLDRYVAVTRPVTYPSIMSTKRAKSLIAGLWVLSFVICFPPLVGWKDEEQIVGYTYVNYTSIVEGDNNSNITQIISTQAVPIIVKNPPCRWTCELTNDAGYVVYSAFGSFYIPMFVMLFFYWRIYRAAVRTTRAINQGFRTTKGKGIGNRFDEQRLTLRIHRGRGTSDSPAHNGTSTPSQSSPALGQHQHSPKASPSTKRLLSRFSSQQQQQHQRKHDKIKISVSYPSSENICSSNSNSQHALYAVHYTNNGAEHTSSHLYPAASRNKGDMHLSVGGGLDQHHQHHQREKVSSSSPRSSRKMGKRNIKAQVKRFRMETKAAKTLAIIVGLFILCWLPFFTMYLIRPFCNDCIDPLLFSMFFWLGYCNSAVNPMIYALFSKDFRFAFKRLICKCCCRHVGPWGRATSRRDSEMSQLKTGGRTPSITPSANAHSLDENSDPMDHVPDR